jgi:MoxR-like ATPase
MDQNLQNLIDALFLCIAMNIPAFIYGKAGIGKTSVVKTIAQSMDMVAEVILVSLRESTDFCGLPYIDQSAGIVRLAAPDWADRLSKGISKLLFLDELTAALARTQVACMRVLLEKVVGSLQLPPETRMVCAANGTEDSAGMNDIIAPLANRVCQIHWESDRKAWSDGMRNGFEVKTSATLPDDWQEERSAAAGLIVEFLNLYPELFESTKPGCDIQTGEAFATPRSWDMATWAFAGWRASKANLEVLSILVSGLVGTGPGIKFSKWVSELNMPNPEMLLADPYQVSKFLPSGRSDKVYSLLSTVASSVLRNNTVDRHFAALKIMSIAANSGFIDLSYPHVRRLIKSTPPGASAAIPDLAVFEPLMNAA